MRIARTQAVALTGTDGHLVTIEADIAAGLPATVHHLSVATRDRQDHTRTTTGTTGL